MLTPSTRHVWTAPSLQGIFQRLWLEVWSGHVFGLLTRFMTAGPDGFRGLGSLHRGALLKRDDGSECPNPGPDLFAVAAVLLLASSPTLRRRLVGKGLSGSTGLSLFSRGLGLRLGTPIGLA